MDKSKLEKVIRLATDPAATNGERAAAVEALRRSGVSLDLEPVVITIPSLDEIEASLETDPDSRVLIPLAMITPTEACIYAPSRIKKPVTVPKRDIELNLSSLSLWVSFSPDGKSNPRYVKAYGGMGSYWFLLDAAGLNILETTGPYVLASTAKGAR